MIYRGSLYALSKRHNDEMAGAVRRVEISRVGISVGSLAEEESFFVLICSKYPELTKSCRFNLRND